MPAIKTTKRKHRVEEPQDLDDFGPSTSKQTKTNQVGLLNLEDRKALVDKLNKDFKSNDQVNFLRPHATDDQSSLFYTVPMDRDGNTLYRSISYILFEHQNCHMKLREVTFKAMLQFKDILDKMCSSSTHTYTNINSYICETRSNEYDRMSNGFLELQALALYFGVPIYLFTSPVSSPPTVFEPKKKSKNVGGFVLFKTGGYFRPVTKFDGMQFQHKMVNNGNLVTISNKENGSFTCSIDYLDTFSADLCRDVVSSDEKFRCTLNNESLNRLSDFINNQVIDPDMIEIDISLFNFGCKYNAYNFIELMMRKVKRCRDTAELIPFLEGLCGDSARFRQELLLHFTDICHSLPNQALLRIKSKDSRLQDIIDEVINSRTKYIPATEDLTVKLKQDDGDEIFAFKDIFPFTVVGFCKKTKTLNFFSGPKPIKSGWIPLELNRRLKSELPNAEQMLFVGKRLYLFYGTKDGKCQIAYARNVFDYTEFLEYKTIPKSSRKLTKPQMVLDEKYICYLIDKDSKQVYSMKENKWLNVQSIITKQTPSFLDHCIVVVKTNDQDEKLNLVLSTSNTPLTSRLYCTTAKGHLKFQYDVSRTVRDFKVNKRLAENELYFDSENQWKESQIIQYSDDLEAHYTVPSAGQHYLYSLIPTTFLNQHLSTIRVSK